jgi:DNA-binding CsgD family transcriptional regulator
MPERPLLSGNPDHPRLPLVLGGAFLAVVAGGVVDLVLDRPRSPWSAHVLFEVGLVALSLGLALYLWTNWFRAARSLHQTTRLLAVRQAERDQWRARADQALEGFGRAIAEQFAAWDLSPSEREVGLLLLKGLSHREIAASTGRSERTVRQHAVAVYRKSGRGGRAELAAFFLDDLILPPP